MIKMLSILFNILTYYVANIFGTCIKKIDIKLNLHLFLLVKITVIMTWQMAIF